MPAAASGRTTIQIRRRRLLSRQTFQSTVLGKLHIRCRHPIKADPIKRIVAQQPFAAQPDVVQPTHPHGQPGQEGGEHPAVHEQEQPGDSQRIGRRMLRRIPAFGNALIDTPTPSRTRPTARSNGSTRRVEQRKHPELPPAGAPAEIDVVTHTFEPPFHRTRGFVFNCCRPAADLRRGPATVGIRFPRCNEYREKIAGTVTAFLEKAKKTGFPGSSFRFSAGFELPQVLTIRNPFHPAPPPLHSQTAARTRTRKGNDRLQQKRQTFWSTVFGI